MDAARELNADEIDDRSAEERLAESEAWYRSLIVHTSDLVLVRSLEGPLTFVSPSVEALLGYSPSCYCALAEQERFHPDDYAEIARVGTRLLATPGATGSTEIRLRHASGEYLTFAVSLTNLTEDPVVRGFVVNARDVTDQRVAERAVVRHAAALRAIVQNSPLAILALDHDGRVQLWNEACCELLGLESGEVIGHSLEQRAWMTDLDEIRLVVMSGGAARDIERRWRREDGALIDVSISMAPIRDGAGRVVTALVVLADVTARRRTEEEVRRSNQSLRAIVDSSPLAIVELSPSLVVRTWNSTAESMFGYAAEEVIGKRLPVGLNEKHMPVFEEYIAGRVAGGESETIEFTCHRRDGTRISVSVSAAPIEDADDGSVSLLAVVADITDRRSAVRALHASEARYRAIVDDQTELICRYTPDGRITFVNDTFARAFGSHPDELLGRPLVEFVPPDRVDAAIEVIENLDGDVVGHVEHEVFLPDGTVVWVNWTHRAVYDEHDEIAEYQAVGRDVTERRRTEMLVADQARILEMIARGSTLNEILTALCGVVEDQIRGAKCSVLLIDDGGLTLRHGGAPSLPRVLVDAIDGIELGPEAATVGAVAYHGEPRFTADIATDSAWAPYRAAALQHGLRSCWALPITNSGNTRVLGALSVMYTDGDPDMLVHRPTIDAVVHLAAIALERKAFEGKLAHQAHHDPLTGLPNRQLFLEFLNHALARVRRNHSSCAVLFLDLDRFKNVNDSLGHDAGDILLVSVAERLRSVLRPGDTVARFGGDEFTILCEDLNGDDAREQAIVLAERLLEVIHQPFVLGGEEAYFGASIGIAVSDTGNERAEALLRDADSAMYRAKDRGKGRFELFDDQMREHAIARLDLENSLHHAVERNEFCVFYQPIVSLTEGRCIGAEALVRWSHPERGLVAPLDFITVAEETGLIVPIGMFVLEEVCREVAQLEDQLTDSFFVSVNLSARQLSQPDLVARVAQVLERTGANPACIGLEITESVLMEDIESGIGSILELRDLGVNLSIDDFGTGYSSLGYLKRLPVDTVKIDRSFVDGLGSDNEDSAIVTAVVSLGHALGLNVVAEGVETEHHLRELVDLGCDHAQGFFFSPPQPVEDLRTLLVGKRWRPPGAGLMVRG